MWKLSDTVIVINAKFGNFSLKHSFTLKNSFHASGILRISVIRRKEEWEKNNLYSARYNKITEDISNILN